MYVISLTCYLLSKYILSKSWLNTYNKRNIETPDLNLVMFPGFFTYNFFFVRNISIDYNVQKWIFLWEFLGVILPLKDTIWALTVVYVFLTIFR